MTTAQVLVILIGLEGGAAPEPAAISTPDEARVRQAIENSVVYLQEEGLDWIRDRKCASCHHAPMMIWALNDARKRGFAVDQAALDEVTTWTLGDPVKAGMLPAPKKPDEAKPAADGEACLNTAYALLAARALPEEAICESRKRMEAHVVAKQQDSGSWTHPAGRPPMFESQEVTTLMTLLALAPKPGEAESKTSPVASLRKAVDWLRRNPSGETSQARALRLAAGVRSGKEPGELKDEIRGILDCQNPDGGWSQADDLPSDAFATGQALYALRLAGLAPGSPDIRRAQGFLVATQTDDGSWPMASRPIKPGGGPAKDLSPITFAGTAWATLGLVSTTPAGGGK